MFKRLNFKTSQVQSYHHQNFKNHLSYTLPKKVQGLSYKIPLKNLPAKLDIDNFENRFYGSTDGSFD